MLQIIITDYEIKNSLEFPPALGGGGGATIENVDHIHSSDE